MDAKKNFFLFFVHTHAHIHIFCNKSETNDYSHILSMQAFNGPRCDLYENIIAHGCNANIITATGSMIIEEVSSRQSLEMVLSP